MGGQNILIVEDDKKVSKLLFDYLENDGFQASIQADGRQVISHIKSDPPDLILLDVMLPGKDGMTLCREIRQFSKVPIIMITARVEEIDRILGLEFGADDYVCKPFSFREVVSRVKAVLRRMDAVPEKAPFAVGPLCLDDVTHQVTANREMLILTPNEFEVLKIMMAAPNKVFSRKDLIHRIQGYGCDGYKRTIDTYIKNIRKKISEKLPGQEIISTVFGVGYKFNATPPPEPGQFLKE